VRLFAGRSSAADIPAWVLVWELPDLDNVCQKDAAAIYSRGLTSTDAFEQFVKRYMKDAYFIALGLVGNRDDALELSQEAFLKAYRNRKQLSSSDKIFPWFYRILRNLCFSHLRKRRLRQAASLDDSQMGRPAPQVGDSFDPEVIAQKGETQKRLWRAIARLDEKHREVIILRHFRGLSYEQMAQMLFCNKGTVTSRLYYARKRLKEILDSEKGGSQQ